MTDPWGVPQAERPQAQQPPAAAPGQQAPDTMPAPGAFGYGTYAYPAPVPRKQSNGLALAGAITSFVPVVGLTLSIIGRVRAKALGGAGKIAGTVGIVLGLVFTGGFCVGGYLLSTSTLADPGCISSDAARTNINLDFARDWQAVINAQNTNDPAQLSDAVGRFADDADLGQQQMRAAAAHAQHANVAAALTSLQNDLGTFAAQARQNPLNPDVEPLLQTSQSITADNKTLDSLCLHTTN